MHGKPWRSGQLAIAALLALFAAGPAAADWKLYVAPDLGISGAMTDTDGAVTTTNPAARFSGEDADASPLLALAVGLEIPMDELVPREWLMGARLPKWPVRFEIEGAGLREYEFSTAGGPDKFLTDVTTSSLLFNTWVDVPMNSAYRPIQYLLGLGRQPRVRRVLEPMSLYFGVGVGVGFTDFDGTTNAIDVDDDVIDFAWNAGAGLSYQLTRHVALAGGYRYVGIMAQTVSFDPGSPAPINASDDVEFDTHIHEFRFQLRIRVFEFLSPWR